MDYNFNQLFEKIDEVLANQKLILEKLNQNSIISDSNNHKSHTTKAKINPTKSEQEKEIREYVHLKMHYAPMLQQKFNLVVEPHINRIKAYLRTNDVKVFDGLKRKS